MAPPMKVGKDAKKYDRKQTPNWWRSDDADLTTEEAENAQEKRMINYYDIYQGTKNLKNWMGCVKATSPEEAVTKAEAKFHAKLLIAVFRCDAWVS